MVANPGDVPLVDVTAKEADMLKQKFADPEFCRLFAEYVKDMQDPKARAEQDAYLAQLEPEGQLESIYGRGSQIVQPDPGFVVKTKTADGAIRVYVNVCTSPKVDKIVIEQQKGQHRSARINMPNMVCGKGDKHGKAADGSPFKTWDFIVHPDTISACIASPDIMDMLVTTAIEGMEKTTRVKLLREFKVTTLRYKGVNPGEKQPAAMLLRTTKEGDVVDGRVRPRSAVDLGSTNGAARGAAPAAAAAAALAAAAPTTPTAVDTAPSRDVAQTEPCRRPASKSTFSFQHKVNAKAMQSSSQPLANKAPVRSASSPRSPPDAVTPQYTLVERARVDLAKTWGDAGRGLQLSSSTPEALIVRIELPGVVAAADMQLDVTPDSVSLQVPGRYRLHLPLRHRIKEQQATAKYNTSKQQMTLTLPVMQLAVQQAAVQDRQQSRAGLGHVEQANPIEQRSFEQPAEQATPGVQVSRESTGQQVHKQAAGTTPDTTALGVPTELPVPGCCSDASHTISAQDLATSMPELKGTQHSTCVSQPPESQVTESENLMPVCDKTANQVKWEQLHRACQPCGQCSSDLSTADGQDPNLSQQEPAQVKQQPEQVTLCVAAQKVAAPLRPRLSSRQVSVSDFV